MFAAVVVNCIFFYICLIITNQKRNTPQTIGHIGTVKGLDRKNRQVLLSFFDSDTACSYVWWYSTSVLVLPERPVRDPFQQVNDATPEELVDLGTFICCYCYCYCLHYIFCIIDNIFFIICLLPLLIATLQGTRHSKHCLFFTRVKR